jgi:hypothetical protein
VALGVATKVVAFVVGTSTDLDVLKDSKSSSACFLFFCFFAPFELAEGGDMLDSVFSMVSSTSSLSRLSVASGASSSEEADSWVDILLLEVEDARRRMDGSTIHKQFISELKIVEGETF